LSPPGAGSASRAKGRPTRRVELGDVYPTPKQRRRYVGVVRRLWPLLRLIIAGISTLVVLAAVLERLVEPKTFTSLGLAMWWAIVTVATVGYGDVIPESPAGRTIAAVVMLFGMAWVPTVTSLVIASFNRSQDEEDAMHAELTAKLDRLQERLEQLERGAGE